MCYDTNLPSVPASRENAPVVIPLQMEFVATKAPVSLAVCESCRFVAGL